MQGSEQPGLHFIGFAQLMALGGPYVKCLLRQIARIRLGPRQAEGKLVERLVETSHQAFKIPSGCHNASSPIRAPATKIVPAMQLAGLIWPRECADSSEKSRAMGTFRNLKPLKLREGFLAEKLNPRLEAS